MNEINSIEIRNLSKSFKVQYDKARTLKELFIRHNTNKTATHEVLKNISLDIHKGETVALIGTNGSGKSTLLKLMTRIIYPTTGTLRTNGKLTSLLELGAGFHPDFTGRENIYFNAAIFGLNETQIEERIDKIIEFSELGKAIDEPIRTYSSGMYMRLAFSIAINVDAEILLIDEILAVGDQHFQDKCYAKLEELKESDMTIVIVSHSLEVVKKLCDRCIWIYNGEIREDGDPIFVISEYLKQIAIDHRSLKKNAVEKGLDNYKGIINIESPKSFTRYYGLNTNIEIKGWKITDCVDEVFSLKIGNNEVKDISFYPRGDVYNLYNEQYNGLLDVNNIGWKAEIKFSEFKNEISSDGELAITALAYDSKGNEICCKSLSIFVS
mgnify:CR=1 FL=1